MEGFDAHEASRIAEEAVANSTTGKKREREHEILGKIKDAATEGYNGLVFTKYSLDEMIFLRDRKFRVVKRDGGESIEVEWDV